MAAPSTSLQCQAGHSGYPTTEPVLFTAYAAYESSFQEDTRGRPHHPRHPRACHPAHARRVGQSARASNSPCSSGVLPETERPAKGGPLCTQKCSLLLVAEDLIHACAADRALALHRSALASASRHGYLFGIVHLSLLLALNAIPYDRSEE